MYVTRDRLNNANFRQKLDPISKNIFRRQNLLELVFKDNSAFDAQNPVIGSLIKELDIRKKDIASTLVKKAPNPVDIEIQSRLNALKDSKNNFNLNNFPPPTPPSPPFFSPAPPGTKRSNMADGISDVSLVEFIPKERNYLDGVINKDEFVNLDLLNEIDANDELLIIFEETGTIQLNCEDLEDVSVFKSTFESDPNISHLEKYIDWKFSETVRPSQIKTQ